MPDELLARHRKTWQAAVHHRFLDAVRDGSLPEAAFDVWLVQDHHFVTDLRRFQERLLARAPYAAVADGLAALEEELVWFEEIAESRGLDLDAERRPATRRAARLLQRLDEADVPVALQGLWAIERAYLDAWAYAAPGAPHLREYVEHWSTPAFGDYVAALSTLCAATPAPDDRAVVEVAEMERAFWDMAWDVSGAR